MKIITICRLIHGDVDTKCTKLGFQLCKLDTTIDNMFVLGPMLIQSKIILQINSQYSTFENMDENI